MKTTIQNRKKQNIVLTVDKPDYPTGLAFVMHGLGGTKEQPHIQAIAETFVENNYTTVRFDTTNTFGESDGQYEDATTTNYLEDLEDVITWSSTQDWYTAPFVLAGHSIAGLCIGLYAQKHPENTLGLAPIATVISGALSVTIKEKNGELEKWKRTGWHETERHSHPGIMKRLKWSHIEDRLQYDLLPEISKLTMPVLLVVGSEDESTPKEHQQLLFNALPGRKTLHIIEGSDHGLRDRAGDFKELRSFFSIWIKSL